MKTILQHDERDCGAACLSMIAQFYGVRLPISKFRELTKTDKEGTNLYGLVEGGRKLGLSSAALSGTTDEFIKSIQNGEIRLPLIAHIVAENGMLHFVVVSGYKNGVFIINDPGIGTRKLNYSAFFDVWTGYIVTFEPTNKIKKQNEVRGMNRKFLRLLKGQYKKLILIMLTSIVISAISIAGAFVFRIILDDISASQSLNEHKAQTISIIFVSLIALYALMAVIQFFRGKLVIIFSKDIDTQLTLDYFFHIADLPIDAVMVRQTGEYLSRFSDIASIRMAISSVTITLLLDTFMAAGCAVVLFIENRTLFLVSLIMIIAYAIVVIVYKKPIENLNRAVMEKNAALQSFFKESIDGIETTKSSCATSKIKDKAECLYKSFIDAVQHINTITVSQDSLIVAIELVGIAVILWSGFEMVADNTISIGRLMTFYALLAYFTEPIKNIIELQSTIQTAFVAADRLNDIMDLETEPQTPDGLRLDKLEVISFEHIDFRYGNRELILKNISLTIRHGEKIGIVGESGSGKTTLARLLLRFYEPERGGIFINGRSIKDYKVVELRNSIAYVQQSPFLFSDTIRNNLKLSDESISDEVMQEVCKMCCAHDFIMSFPLGYDTPLDENGMNLSGGQRQRLSIARAMLKTPQLLIMDEATSNLDTITETGIKNTVFSLGSELTCIIIAHRVSTVRNCDRIFVMDDGKIIESGNHTELISKNGKYAELWNNQ